MNKQQLVYATSPWDSYRWNQFSVQRHEVSRTLNLGEQKVGTAFNAFVLEVFHRIHLDKFNQNSGNFILARLPNIPPEAQWAECCHNELDQIPEWQQLIGQCGGDRLLAGLATNNFCLKLAETLPTPETPLSNIQALRNQVKGLKDFQEYLEDNGGTQAQIENLKHMIEELIQKGKTEVKKASEYAKQIGDLNNSAWFRHNLRVATNHVLEEIAETKESLSLFGATSEDNPTPASNSGNNNSIKQKLMLANCFAQSAKLREISKQAGRLKRMREQFGGKKQTPFWDVANIPIDIRLGNEIQRLLTHELAYLADEDLFLAFADNYINRNLMELKMGDFFSEEMGAIVVLVDSSTSMRGCREIWSKAIALNLAHCAQNNERDFCIIHFTQHPVRVDYFPKNEEFEPKKLIKSMEYFSGGGTHFQAPLEKALEQINLNQSFKKADLILITDGEADLHEEFITEWNATKSEQGFNLYGILVETQIPLVLEKICDHLITIADITSDSAVAQLLTKF